MNTFSYLLDGMDEFDSIVSHIKKGSGLIHSVGVSSSQKSHLIYALSEHIASKCLIVAPDESKAGRIVKELSFLCCDEVLYFPSREYIFYDVDVSNRKGEYNRLKSLCNIEKAKVIVTTVSALSTYTLPYEYFKKYSININMESTVDMAELISSLIFMGYSRVGTVENVGQFSVRGSIIDVFTPSSDTPYRIELWDDEVDSIRRFNPVTQLSEVNAENVFICPVRELIYTKEDVALNNEKIREMKNENLLRDIERFSQNHYFPANDKYMPMFYQKEKITKERNLKFHIPTPEKFFRFLKIFYNI